MAGGVAGDRQGRVRGRGGTHVSSLPREDAGGWVARGIGQEGADAPQMTVGTLPLLLFRLLFFRDRLGVAMSTKRSSGQPYCSSTSMHSWLAACRA